MLWKQVVKIMSTKWTILCDHSENNIKMNWSELFWQDKKTSLKRLDIHAHGLTQYKPTDFKIQLVCEK